MRNNLQRMITQFSLTRVCAGVLDKEELIAFIYGNHKARRGSHEERQKEQQEWMIGDMKMASDFEEQIRAPMPHRPERRRRKLRPEEPTWKLAQEGKLKLPQLNINKKKRYGAHTSRRKIHQHRRLKVHQRKQKDRERLLPPKRKKKEQTFEMVLPRLS